MSHLDRSSQRGGKVRLNLGAKRVGIDEEGNCDHDDNDYGYDNGCDLQIAIHDSYLLPERHRVVVFSVGFVERDLLTKVSIAAERITADPAAIRGTGPSPSAFPLGRDVGCPYSRRLPVPSWPLPCGPSGAAVVPARSECRCGQDRV